MTLASTLRLAFATLFVAALLTPGSAAGQTGDDALRLSQRMPGVSAASIAMGGVGVAGTADASAFFTNPAGLGWANGSWVSGAISSIGITDDATFSAPGHQTSFANDVTSTGLGSLSYVYKLPTVRGSFVAGASINQVQTFERSLIFEGLNDGNLITDFFMPLPGEFTLEEDAQGIFPEFSRTLSFIAYETFAIDLNEDLIDAGEPVPFLPAVSFGTIEQTGFVEEEGRMTEFSVGGAVEVAKDVMVGVSLNVPYGSYSFRRIHQEFDINNDNDGVSNGTTDFDYLEFEESFQSDIVGVNLRTGVSAKIADGLRAGVSIETPTYLSIDDNFETRLRTEFDNGDVFLYGDDRSEQAGSGTFDYSVTSPWKIAAGGSFTQQGATISADVEWIDWSQMEIDSETVDFLDENLAIKRGLDSVLNLRLGASYAYDQLEVRGGFAYYPDPRGDTIGTLDVDRPERDRSFISAGIGYRFTDEARVDIGWMREAFDDRYQPYTEVTGAPVITEQVSRNRFMLGFTFGF